MIDVELKLQEIFSHMCGITDAKGKTHDIKFDWGTNEVLNKYLAKVKQPYPLVWLVEDENQLQDDQTTRNARFIIATRSMMQNEFNTFQHKTDFEVILRPTMKKVLKALKVNGMTSINKDYRYQFIKNYAFSKDKTATIDVWNVIVLDVEIKFINNCIINKKY